MSVTENHIAPYLKCENDLLDSIEHILRSVAALRVKLESWPWTGASPIAERSHLAILVRKYPEEARNILAELETANGDQPDRDPGEGIGMHGPQDHGRPL